MDEVFTLEKMKVNDRLSRVEVQLVELNTLMKSHVELDMEIHKDIREVIKKYDILIFGNGSEVGIKTRIFS